MITFNFGEIKIDTVQAAVTQQLIPNTEIIVTLTIPGKVAIPGKIVDNQVSLGYGSFSWKDYDDFCNLKVNPIFQLEDNVYAKMPENCTSMLKGKNASDNKPTKISTDFSGVNTSYIKGISATFYNM